MDYWTIALFHVLYQYFTQKCLKYFIKISHIPYVQYNYLDYWTIGLLLYFMFSNNTLTHILEYKKPCSIGLLDCWTISSSIFSHVLYEYLLEYMVLLPVGLSDYWTIALFDVLYQYFTQKCINV